MNICMYGASSERLSPFYLNKIEEFGEILAVRGHRLIYGGGGQGLMGAAARGVTAAGGQVIGVAPAFFKADGVLFEQCTEFIYTDTMRQRKQIMEDRSDAFVMVPGGIGTFEEFFEILTLKQLGRHCKPIGIYNLQGYFDPIQQMMEKAIREGFMEAACRKLYCVFSDAKPLFAYLESYDPAQNTQEVYKKV